MSQIQPNQTMEPANGMTPQNENITLDNMEGTCIERKNSTVIMLTFIPMIALLCNVVAMVAVVLYRTKLKQNNVYIYVFSVLSSNILFSTLSTYQLFNHYYQFEGNPAREFSAVTGWWVFRKALLVGTYLIMVANIGALIYAIRSGNYIVAKAASVQGWNEEESATSLIQRQKRRAYMLVSVAWIVPLVLALLTLTGWNCSNTCECLSGCYNLEDMNTVHPRACSRIMSSLSNSYMGITVVVWVVETTLLFTLICKTYSQSVLLSAGCLKIKFASAGNNGNEADQPRDESLELKMKRLETESTTITETQHARDIKQSRRSRRVDRRQKRYAKWLRLASRQLTFLTMLFFACTLPAMTCLLVDIFRKDMIESTTSSILISLPLLYSIVCPVVLAKDLAGMKKAFYALVLRCFPVTKSKHSTATGTSTTASDTDRERKYSCH